MELARDEVRVMTVHGAKGLEANMVVPRRHHDAADRQAGSAAVAIGQGRKIVWAKGQKEDVGAMAEARGQSQQDARDEYRRLLYVAMTRAAERLIVCGAKGVNKNSRRLLVSTGRRRADRRLRDGAGRRRRRRGAALSQGRDAAGSAHETG